ncbi:putative DNA methylase, N-6 adenine-specific [Helianthus annuus]|uniref:DNA methylase, N-6 adenine-specific n=1 Tax=Helianthus annuus TaxID=4232 RepID=A0A251SFM2_HELAN|nr:methyltransferase-like protein 2 [Helianthus annuus]KAF5796952.1 putative DNA methylase, N-6 adenine-specific [Helianthus annuus]KAJ0548670.1 putative DNA methylase, N-6 adenine-specific [Helianthus annuus]KAJ0723709.1 putative DNA methylase, N-6 adenine-specific [Helianthus annuus]KAJ0899561.1 putative DNA methylase, N-6 adenine-specific [Helianthus annuus]KAJ0903127.1 putative DNA methylase, N-6 adenine-specific [Helianthus annuus]
MTTEAVTNNNQKLSRFMKSGIYRFQGSNAVVFVDPVRLLNLSYSHFRVTPSSYYSRFFQPNPRVSQNQTKRKRKRKQKELNQREQAADERHQRVKPLLMNAHECLLRADDLFPSLGKLRMGKFEPKSTVAGDEQSFVELGSVWQAPLFEISLHLNPDYRLTADCTSLQNCEKKNVPAFGSLVSNETDSDMEADFMNRRYIIPKHSSFYMSDLKQIHGLIPGKHECGFNLIVIDPPWENGSANQKSKYPTLPNRYFLSLPIKRLAHADEGALVALWVTNKEKLRIFVEKDLFPKWGVEYMATHYWLKVKADGSLISELDLFHHRPYECLILGYCYGKDEDSEYLSKLKSIPDCQVFISIPGDYSRKPPVGEMLREYIPGLEPARCLELFARELLGGWTSWGNEPLRFQDSRYFSRKDP